MNIVAVGTNHKQACIEVRENIAFKPGQDAEFLERLSQEEGLSEAVVLSTCNRTEVYAILANGLTPEWLTGQIFTYHNLDGDAPRKHMYTLTGKQAIEHLFKVSSSLDSLVLGESQIISQVKSAYFLAKEKGTTGPNFNLLFKKCFMVAKKVHSSTEISRNKVSISSIAVDLVRQKLGELSEKTVLIVGSGKVGRLSAEHFIENGISKIFVANRTPSKAETVASGIGAKAEAVPLERINEIFLHVDVVVGCTSAKQHILHRRRCSEYTKARNGKPLFIVDLGVPRNVDPEVATLPGIHLYNIDQLEEIALSNMATRQKSADEALELVMHEVEKTVEQLEAADRHAVAADLTAKLEAIRTKEISRSLGKIGDLTEKQRAELEYLTKRIVKKILHNPLSKLKPPIPREQRQENLKALENLFG